jgi:hypothetical protein
MRQSHWELAEPARLLLQMRERSPLVQPEGAAADLAHAVSFATSLGHVELELPIAEPSHPEPAVWHLLRQHGSHVRIKSRTLNAQVTNSSEQRSMTEATLRLGSARSEAMRRMEIRILLCMYAAVALGLGVLLFVSKYDVRQ